MDVLREMLYRKPYVYKEHNVGLITFLDADALT